MKTVGIQPQMSQMNADVLLKFFICANLCNLRLNHPDKALRGILEKIGEPPTYTDVPSFHSRPLPNPLRRRTVA